MIVSVTNLLYKKIGQIMIFFFYVLKEFCSFVKARSHELLWGDLKPGRPNQPIKKAPGDISAHSNLLASMAIISKPDSSLTVHKHSLQVSFHRLLRSCMLENVTKMLV